MTRQPTKQQHTAWTIAINGLKLIFICHIIHMKKLLKQIKFYLPFSTVNAKDSCILTYECKKQSKKLLKQKQNFTADKQSLIKNTLNFQIFTPNFFAKQLQYYTFKKEDVSSNQTNHFFNSYISLHLPLSSDKNLSDRLNKLYDGQVRVGRILEIMDSIAGIVSYHHCFGTLNAVKSNPMICVTGSVQNFHQFDKILIGEDIEIEGYLNHSGKTSMQIQINLYQNNYLKSNSLFTMIARDAKIPSKGYDVPALSTQLLNTQEKLKAQLRLNEAKQNILRRKIQIQNSYDKKSPSPEQIQEIHEMFLKRKNSIDRISTIPIGLTAITNYDIMHTQQRNIHGKIFGGHLMRKMYEIGWLLGCKYAEDYIELCDLTNIYFKKPVDIGCRLALKAQVTYVEKNRLVITVQAYTGKFMQMNQNMACYLHLIVKSKKQQKPVHPESYEQALQYLSSRKAFREIFY